jgi:hypothetical protein
MPEGSGMRGMRGRNTPSSDNRNESRHCRQTVFFFFFDKITYLFYLQLAKLLVVAGFNYKNLCNLARLNFV